jgi:phosphate-selective porin OprO/OprP
VVNADFINMKSVIFNILKLSCATAIIWGNPFTSILDAQEADGNSSKDLISLQQQIDDLKSSTNDQANHQEAEETSIPSEQKKKSIYSWDGGPRLESSDGRFSLRFSGRITYDYGNITYKDVDGIKNVAEKVNGIENRHQELGIRGNIFRDISYRLVTRFRGNEATVRLAFLEYDTGKTRITAGQIRTYTTLDRMTPPQNHTFTERFAFVNAIRANQRVGVSAARYGNDWSVTGGYYYEDIYETDLTLDENHIITGRVNYSPILVNGLGLHFGSSFFTRNENGKPYDFEYTTRPISRQGDLRPLFSGEFNIIRENFIGAEFAAIYGPFGIQAEYAQISNIISNQEIQTSRNPTYEGAYVELGYFLTGATRMVDGSDGRFNNVDVDNPVGGGGYGEVRVAARYDVADFTHETFGQKQKSIILSSVWYLNNHLRLIGTYGHSTIKDAQDIKTDIVDTFSARLMFFF